MDEIGALSDTISAALALVPPIADWHLVLFAGSTLVAFGVLARHRMKQGYLDWRAERRRRDPLSHRQDADSLQRELFDEKEEFDALPALARAIGSGLYVTTGIWLAGSLLGNWLELALFVVPLLALPVWLWRRLNDPPPEEPTESYLELPDASEAWVGLVGPLMLLMVLFLVIGLFGML